MRWALAVLLTCAGCRQLLGIDDGVAPDAALGAGDGGMNSDARQDGGFAHDEDEDDVDDRDDNCPATANPSQTSSDPLIGEACDPSAVTPGDRVALFVPFFPAGQPTTLMPVTNGAFGNDWLTLTSSEIRTIASYRATRITIALTVETFTDQSSLVEISTGTTVCRLQRCNNMLCLTAEIDTANTATQFTPSELSATMELTDDNGKLVCRILTASAMPVTVELPGTARASAQVRVRNRQSVIRLDNLVIYDR